MADNTGNHPPANGMDKSGGDASSQPYARGIDAADATSKVLLFSKKGDPAFWDYWPQGTPREQMRTLTVSIASKSPEFLARDTAAYRYIDDMFGDYVNVRTHADFGDSLGRIDERTLSAFKDYAREFEKTYGIHLDIQSDNPNAQLTLLATDMPMHTYAKGLSSLPVSADHYGSALKPADIPAPLKLPQGVILLNKSEMAAMTDRHVHDTVRHEMLHFLGITDLDALPERKTPAAPLDMAMDKRYAMSMASYGFREGMKYSSTGEQIDLGTLELGLRHYMPNPPPELNRGDRLYDLEQLEQRNLKDNANVDEQRVPALPIIAGSGHNTLKVSESAVQSFIDTNPGHCGEDVYANPRDTAKPLLQDVCLVEGHIGAIEAVKGNNRIILDQQTQKVVLGEGNNILQILSPNIGEKTIDGANYTLAIDESVLKNTAMKSAQDGSDLVLTFAGSMQAAGGSLHLAGNAKGLHDFVVTRDGKAIYDMDVKGLSTEDLSKKIAGSLSDLRHGSIADGEQTPEASWVAKPSDVPAAGATLLRKR